MTPLEQLGLPSTASLGEITKRWRELAGQHHPDHGGDTETFHALRVAYEQARNAARAPSTCPTCQGKGYVMWVHGFNSVKMICPTCNRRGKVHGA